MRNEDHVVWYTEELTSTGWVRVRHCNCDTTACSYSEKEIIYEIDSIINYHPLTIGAL